MSIKLILDQLAETSSRLDKEAILKANANNEELKQVIKMALNPFQQFYIRKIPAYKTRTDIPSEKLSWAFERLTTLSSRNITGNAAIEYLTFILENVDENDAIVVERIIGKDLRCGVSTSTANKIFPGLVPTFECMLADKWDEKRVTFPVSVETKLDGIRCLAFVGDNSVEFYSRGGKPFNTLASLEEDILKSGKFAGFVLDGELVSGNFNNTVSEIKRKEGDAQEVQFVVFDIMAKYEFDQQNVVADYELRRAKAWNLIQGCGCSMVTLSKSSVCWNVQQIHETYSKYIESGYEGAIVKPHSGKYEFKRSKNWLKIKPEETVDVEITGYEEGTGKYEGKLGAFIVNFGGVECRVGGGYSDMERESFWVDRESMVGSLIETQFMEITPDGAMRHPRFIRVRSYKGEKF